MRVQQSTSNQPARMAIIVTISVLVATAMAIVLHLTGASPATVVTVAGAAFATTMTLCLRVWTFLDGVDQDR